ncbi:hypothetical protein [uncultured Roseobacter sp.]|uniref:hypothetical protein n=1 Tax=uncultured Roseobacter sp. TaxID=114847 RepID=UPI002612C810|nr:hypothetical protein [uncultured Roseobacter sp.]
MAGLYVPELARKLKLLVREGHYPDLKAIAAALGRSWITVKGWGNDGRDTPPNTVPLKNVDALISVFHKSLPHKSPEQLRHLLTGPADDLEALLSPGDGFTLAALINQEAVTGSAQLFTKPHPSSRGFVRRAGTPADAPEFRVHLGQPFRLEFATRSRASFCLALQKSPAGWAALACSLDREHRRIHLLAAEEDGSLPFMIEDQDAGAHMFVVAQAAEVFPRALYLAGRDGVPLHQALLKAFKDHFESQSRSTRKLMSVEIEFYA